VREIGAKDVVRGMMTGVVKVLGFIRSLELLCCVMAGKHGKGSRDLVGRSAKGTEIDWKHVVGREADCCQGGAIGAELDNEVCCGAHRVGAVVSSATLEVAE
jgi:hypothetical protein